MPLFFLISGLFVKEAVRHQTFIDFVKSRAPRLLIPYLTFGIISYIFWFSWIGRIKGDILPTNPLLYFLINTIYGVGGYGWLNYNLTLWFFPCLLVVELFLCLFRNKFSLSNPTDNCGDSRINSKRLNLFLHDSFFFLIRLPSRQILIAILFLLSVSGYFFFYFFNIENFRLPFGIDIALTAVVFYGLGYLVRPYLLDDSFRAWYRPPFVALGMLAYIIFSNLNERSAFVIGNFGKNYCYFYLAALSGILFWAQLSRLVKPNRLFEEIGKNTLVIFPLHLLLFPFFTGILVYLFKIPKETIDRWSILGIFYAVMAILMLVPVAWTLNHYTSFLLGKKSP